MPNWFSSTTSWLLFILMNYWFNTCQPVNLIQQFHYMTSVYPKELLAENLSNRFSSATSWPLFTLKNSSLNTCPTGLAVPWPTQYLVLFFTFVQFCAILHKKNHSRAAYATNVWPPHKQLPGFLSLPPSKFPITASTELIMAMTSTGMWNPDCCLFPGRLEQSVPPKRWYISTKSDGVTSNKPVILSI
jgi:hypothetical protein